MRQRARMRRNGLSRCSLYSPWFKTLPLVFLTFFVSFVSFVSFVFFVFFVFFVVQDVPPSPNAPTPRHSSTTRRSASDVRSAMPMRVASVASCSVSAGVRSNRTQSTKCISSRRKASAKRS